MLSDTERVMLKQEKTTEELLTYLKMLPDGFENKFEYDINMKKGKAHTKGIINETDVSVAKTFFAKGTVSDWHVHEETEHFMVFNDGSLDIEYEKDGEIIVKTIDKNHSCYVQPNMKHRLKTTYSDCWLIIVLIPGSNTFPRGLD